MKIHNAIYDEDVPLSIESEIMTVQHILQRHLVRDLKLAATALTPDDVRMLVDLYYQCQRMRIRLGNQTKAQAKAAQGAPVAINAFLQFLYTSSAGLETRITQAMQVHAEQSREGRWLLSQYGIGPVLASGLLAHLLPGGIPATVGSWWRFCFPGGTLVNTPSGMKPIETFAVGDAVCAHDGQATQVTKTWARMTDEPVYRVTVHDMPPITATGEHPFYARVTQKESASWMAVQELHPGMFLAVPSTIDDKGIDAYSINRHAWFDQGFWWTPITDVEEQPWHGMVYNLTTETETYCVQHLAVHNCGYDPTVVWKKGAKRPWNTPLKTLCVLPDQMVTTRKGAIPIADICVGDEVLTHTGSWRKVLRVYKNSYAGPVAQVRSHGHANQGPWLTYGHPVFVRPWPVQVWQQNNVVRWRKHSRKREPLRKQAVTIRALHADGLRVRTIAKLLQVSEAKVSMTLRGKRNRQPPTLAQWIAIEDLSPGWDVFSPCIPAQPETIKIDLTMGSGMIATHGYVGAQGRWEGAYAPRTILIPSTIVVDTRMARFIGLYLAEGHVSRNATTWSFHRQEVEYHAFIMQTLHDVFGLQADIRHRDDANSTQIHAFSKALSCTFSHLFGKGAYQKHLPASWLSSLGDEEALSLLQGLYEGDGCGSERTGRMLKTVSRDLAYQVQLLAQRLGMLTSVSRYDSEKYGTSYTVRLLVRGKGIEQEQNGSWHPIQTKQTRYYEGDVYNLEVEHDHSYVVENITVHNCWKAASSFVKFSNRPECFYGHIYRERKGQEVQYNTEGRFAEQAAEALKVKRYGTDTIARKHYEQGQLPPAHLEARAKRYAAKYLLSHLHFVCHVCAHGRPPRDPYAIAFLDGHSHRVDPPGWPCA